jgi:hypothetical protein
MVAHVHGYQPILSARSETSLTKRTRIIITGNRFDSKTTSYLQHILIALQFPVCRPRLSSRSIRSSNRRSAAVSIEHRFEVVDICTLYESDASSSSWTWFPLVLAPSLNWHLCANLPSLLEELEPSGNPILEKSRRVILLTDRS